MISKVKHYINISRLFPYLLIFPTLVLIGTLDFYPMIKVIELSIQNYNLARFYEYGYIGIENYQHILTDTKYFYPALWISFKWVTVQVSLQLLIGIIVALLLNQTFKGRVFIRALVFMPWAISGVLTAILFLMIYNQSLGLLNNILIDLGFISKPIAWLGNPSYVFSSVVVADLWRGFPFFAIILLAALQTIPREINEASEIDGCGMIRKFFSITLPYLKQTIVFTTLLRVVWEFNSIDLILNLTNGGPINLTTTFSLYMYKTSILLSNYGYGSAMAVIGFAIMFLFAFTYLSLNKFGRGIHE